MIASSSREQTLCFSSPTIPTLQLSLFFLLLSYTLSHALSFFLSRSLSFSPPIYSRPFVSFSSLRLSVSFSLSLSPSLLNVPSLVPLFRSLSLVLSLSLSFSLSLCLSLITCSPLAPAASAAAPPSSLTCCLSKNANRRHWMNAILAQAAPGRGIEHATRSARHGRHRRVARPLRQTRTQRAGGWAADHNGPELTPSPIRQDSDMKHGRDHDPLNLPLPPPLPSPCPPRRISLDGLVVQC